MRFGIREVIRAQEGPPRAEDCGPMTESRLLEIEQYAEHGHVTRRAVLALIREIRRLQAAAGQAKPE